MQEENLHSPKQIEDKPLDRDIYAHKVMHYQCKSCGRVFRMWLETGLEDETSNERKPVPFSIECLCGDSAIHIAWHRDIKLDAPMPIFNGMDYFENVADVDHGVPHIRTNGDSAVYGMMRNAEKTPFIIKNTTKTLGESLKELGTVLSNTNDKIPKIEAQLSGLERYSTTQLKEELRRRRRM